MDDQTTPRDGNVSLYLMNGNHPFERKELRGFLNREAQIFGTEIKPEGFENLIRSVQAGKVQIVFAVVAEQVAGAAVQFPTVVPKWNAQNQSFQFFPAIYSEDMSVSKEISQEFREKYKTGIGTAFMQDRIRAAANPDDGTFDFKHKFPARALLGEQSWPEGTAIARLLQKFNSIMAATPDESVLLFRKPQDFFKHAGREVSGSRMTVNQLLIPLNDGHFKKADGMFSVSWAGRGGEQIAATYTLGVASFTGVPVIRVNIATSDHLPTNGSLREALRSVLKQGAFQAVQEGWVADLATAVNFLRIHALAGEEPNKEAMKTVRDALRTIGVQDRKLGNFVMHPLFMDFEKIPPTVGLTLAQSSPFLAVPIQSKNGTTTSGSNGPVRPRTRNVSRPSSGGGTQLSGQQLAASAPQL